MNERMDYHLCKVRVQRQKGRRGGVRTVCEPSTVTVGGTEEETQSIMVG